MASLWAFSWPLTKIALNYVPPMTLVFHRFVLSAASLFPFALLLKKKLPKERHLLLRLFFFSALYVSFLVTQVIGLGQENSGIVSMVTYTQPLFVFCLAVPFLREKTSVTKILGTTIGFAGVIVLFVGRIGYFSFDAVLITLFGAFSWATSIVYYKKSLSQVDPFVAQLFTSCIGAFLLATLNLTTKWSISTNVYYVLILVYVSVGTLALGTVIWLHLLRKEEATVLSGSSLIVPAMALLFGFLILGETISMESVVGCFFTLLGIYMVNLKR